MACLVVAATVQFHQTCDKLTPYFREEWSRNIENIETCQNAPELLEKITKHAAHNNLEMDFKNTPVNPSGPNNWQTTKDEPNKEEGAEKTVKAGLRGKLKSSQHKMPPAMWAEYVKHPQCIHKLPHDIKPMRLWCASNGYCYRCYKEDCLKVTRNNNLMHEQKVENRKKVHGHSHTRRLHPKKKSRSKTR